MYILLTSMDCNEAILLGYAFYQAITIEDSQPAGATELFTLICWVCSIEASGYQFNMADERYWELCLYNVMLLEKLAGIKRRLGVYRFLPLFFVIGAGIELFMIKVRIGRETFCKLSLFGLCNIELM